MPIRKYKDINFSPDRRAIIGKAIADGTAKARQWADENPTTAIATGVTEALRCATRWKKARDALLLQQEADERTGVRLLVELKRLLEHAKASGQYNREFQAAINDADTAVRLAEKAGWRSGEQ